MKKYLLKIKKLIILIFIAYGVLSLINIFNPIINAKLLTSLTNFNLNEAYKYTFIFFAISILSVLINKLAIKLLGKIHEKLLYDIRYDIIQRLFKLKMKNFDEIPSGKFQERIKNDPEGIFSVFSVVQYNIFNIITEVFMLAYVMYLNIIIGLIYILGIIIIYFYEKYAYEKFEKLEEESKIQREKSGTILNEILRGIRDIKLLGITNKVNKMTSETLDKQSKLDTKISISRMNIYNTTEIVKDILIFIIIFLGIFLININKLTLTTFLIIFMYRNDIFSLVFSYTSLKEYLVKYKVAKNRIMELFDNKKFPIETYGNESIDNIKGEIEFKNVSFAYNKKEIIHNVSFKVNSLEDVALVGKSGSGKSTLFNLLTKSYDNYEGIITIDGVDIKKLNQKTLIDSISIISQNPYIFNLSIKDNLKLIDKNITDDDIINACKTARIHDFIETLPDKYNTLLGEGGVNLSGGQKQRLAIARALLKQSKILLFDEATSSLDNITQDEIQTAIKSISKNFTIITIAHRLSTIINSNKIYLLEEGNIIACGTHKELLKSNTYYKEHEIVLHEGVLYRAEASHIAGADFQQDLTTNAYWLEISLGGSSNSYRQIDAIEVVAPKQYNVAIPYTDTFLLPPVEALKFKSGGSSLTKTIYDFNASDSNDFEKNDLVKFDGILAPKTDFGYPMGTPGTIGTSNIQVSEWIDFNDFKKLDAIEAHSSKYIFIDKNNTVMGMR